MQRSDLEGEVWKPVVGYEGFYEVSNLGRVWSVPRVTIRDNGYPLSVSGKFLTPTRIGGRNDWVRVRLCTGSNDSKSFLVHRLVLEAFVGPCPEGMVACHYDDEPTNNILSNLRWDTQSENEYDRVRNGKHVFAKRTHCKHGHEFTPENTSWYTYRDKPGKYRICKECGRLRTARARLAAKNGLTDA